VIYLAAFLSVSIFVITLWLFGTISVAIKTVEVSRESTKTIRNPALSDENKERTLQKASLTLLGSLLSITARAAAAVGASLLPMLAFDVAGLANFRDVADFLATWEAIILVSAVLMLVYLVRRRF
jgi:hypothetical protein